MVVLIQTLQNLIEMKLKNLVLNSLKNVDLSMIDIKEPSKEFLDLIKKEIILQRKKNYSFPIPKIDKLQIPNFVFLLRTLDFRRWEFKKNWVYKNKKRFWALFSKLEDLFKIGVKNIDYKIFKKIISPKESDSLGKLRFKFFKKNLLWLKNNYDGNFKNYFEKNKNPLNFTLGLTNLGRFEDIAKNSKKIYFLKPNQLLYTEYLLATNQMKKYSFQDPVGQQLQMGKNMFTIIGVVKPWPENSFVYANIDNATTKKTKINPLIVIFLRNII